MSIISIRMEVETMSANYLTKGEHVDGEEEGSRHRPLRHTLVDWSWGGTYFGHSVAVADVNSDG